MDSVDLEVLRSAAAWRREGHQVTLATVVETWGSAPRPVGAMLAIRGDGKVSGSVSGGCVEDDMIEKMTGAAVPTAPQLLTYGVTREQAERFGLPCGGRLAIVVEPVADPALDPASLEGIEQLIAASDRRELTLRTLDMHSGRATLAPGSRDAVVRFDGKTLQTVHGPLWRLLLIGAGQLSRYLAEMARTLDYRVTVCDPREEYVFGWDVPGVDLVRTMPDDTVVAMELDSRCAVVALTHDPKLDDLALMEALKSPAFYVGALGSRANNERRRERLTGFDLSEAEIARLFGPVGLPIGSKTPPEIAVSILAEMTAVRRGLIHAGQAERTLGARPAATSEALSAPGLARGTV
ncbi:MAG: XdhC family protein [Proteobacteria bacterium]|nr:XdhC family protein [Burkholderiales bacterium]